MPLNHPQLEQALNRIVDRLVTEYRPDKIVLFGSHAHSDGHTDSDFDLLLIKKTNEPFLDRLNRVRMLLGPIQGLIALDVLVLTPDEVQERLRIGDQFVQHMVEQGRLLHAA